MFSLLFRNRSNRRDPQAGPSIRTKGGWPPVRVFSVDASSRWDNATAVPQHRVTGLASRGARAFGLEGSVIFTSFPSHDERTDSGQRPWTSRIRIGFTVNGLASPSCSHFVPLLF